jgi:hypothetical protein
LAFEKQEREAMRQQ